MIIKNKCPYNIYVFEIYDILNVLPLEESHLNWVPGHCEAQFDGYILSIGYPPSDAVCLIRKNIIQEWNDKYYEITQKKKDRLFLRFNFSCPFSPCRMTNLQHGKVKHSTDS